MDKKYLLTYQNNRGDTFKWFETEEEMNEFISSNKILVIEAFKINDAEAIH